MERTARQQMGKPVEHNIVITPSQAEQAAIGCQWFDSFEESMYPDGVAEVTPDLWQCLYQAAKLQGRQRYGLKLQWTSPFDFKFRQVRIVKKG